MDGAQALESQRSRWQTRSLAKLDGQFVHRLPGTSRQRADLFERRIVDQIGTDAEESDAGAQAPRFECPPICHPDQQAADYVRGHSQSLFPRISGFAKEVFRFGFHNGIPFVARIYLTLGFGNRAYRVQKSAAFPGTVEKPPLF